MNIENFYNVIITTMNEYLSHIHSPAEKNPIQKFVDNLKIIFTNKKLDISLKMTKLTILFEGFYRSIKDNSDLKKILINLRLQRWSHHFGTPTLTFLLTYEAQIDYICDHFIKNENSLAISFLFSQTKAHVLDITNNVVVNADSISDVSTPEHEEVTGQLAKTHNPIGGFTTTPCDPFSQKFIEYVTDQCKNGAKVLEIGAGFGAASLLALARGATVFCNDIEPKNLAVVLNRFYKRNNESQKSVSGDQKKLVFVPGSLPEELSGLPKESFDAILICRVLHFLPGIKIEQTLKQMASFLKPGGKLFIICETPFLKNWKQFIPEYEKRVTNGLLWPGEITNPKEFESSGRSVSLPNFVHWITKEVIDRSLQRTNFFEIEESHYINRRGQFPEDLLLDGKESVGAVAVKL